MYGNYRFKPEDAERFAYENHFSARRQGDELVFAKCPYCGASSGTDKNKFAINLRSGQFNCFRASCRAKGNMLTLAKDFNFSLGREVDEYIRPQRHYRIFKQPEEPLKPTDEAVEYLRSRGISEAVAQKYCIKSNADGTIIFPFFDENNEIVSIKYRNPAPKEGQSKEWFEKNCKPILFGMGQCSLDNKTLIVTEGQMDSLSVAEAGYDNAVSVPGGVSNYTWVPYCWDWMKQFDRIIIFGDYEKGTVTLYDDFVRRWGSKVWKVSEANYKDCKDANDILRRYGAEQIRKCIDEAEQTAIPKVIDIADVEKVDIAKLPKLSTGIHDLDDTLRGGLPYGQVVLLTGKAGDGKSTFASYIIANAINQDINAFIYSGEMPNFIVKDWLVKQLAGDGYIEKLKPEGRWTEYEVMPEVYESINAWLKGRVEIYDSRITEDESEEDMKLLELLEEVIERNGTRVILLDNLMTAIDLEPITSDGKYDQQSLFIKKLARLALRKNVIIILVAHKRKTIGSDKTNDAVSGSADIVNLASIVLSYERATDKDKDGNPDAKRILRITKNRLYGALDEKGIPLDFEESSRRVFRVTNNGERKRIFNWDTDYNGFIGAKEEDLSDLPWMN